MDILTPSRFGSLGDDGAFHVPIPGLYADLDSGSGSVALTDAFAEASPRVRIDVLQHWIRALNDQRDAAFVEMFRDFAQPLHGMTIVEQIERFRSSCARQGRACPANLPVLLQRF